MSEFNCIKSYTIQSYEKEVKVKWNVFVLIDFMFVERVRRDTAVDTEGHTADASVISEMVAQLE